MKICFIADPRSSIARNWISYFPRRGHEVHLLATGLGETSRIEGVTVHSLVSGSQCKRKSEGTHTGLSKRKFRFDPSSFWGRAAFSFRDQVLLPAKCITMTRRARSLIKGINPDLLHALRIPIEGELGGRLGVRPFIASVWGNDFTLHARHSFAHRILTRQALRVVDGLLADADIDLQRAHALQPTLSVPLLRIPGCGGLEERVFYSAPGDRHTAERFGIDPNRPVVLNPRGLRHYVRHDTFFAAIPQVLAQRPDTQFVAVDLKGWRWAEKWIHSYRLESSVILTNHLSQTDLAELYRLAVVTVSPTEHDGTPNTLLEAMASGCLPICGDLPSIREWIIPDVNGLLFDAGNSETLTNVIIRGLSDKEFRENAARHNEELISERADYGKCMPEAESFYLDIVQESRKQLNKAA